ncbi:chitin synthase G [Physcia stellaris]|nr:chitin synthase G [Physcia stellaris]
MQEKEMAFPASRAPNFLHCRNDLAHPVRPQFSDCVSAFHDLPTGSGPVLWDNTGNAQDPYASPYFASHGTCEIVFDLAGPGAEKVHRIYVSGNEVRQMAGRVIEECIEPGGERSGAGFVTKSFENLLSSIATPGNHFFENPPAASTFLTLLIWPHIREHGDFSYNPGDKDYQVAEHIATTLRAAQHRYAPGSPSRRELEARWDAIDYVLPKLDAFNEHNPTWWDYYPAPDLGCGRGGGGIGNGTAVARRAEGAIVQGWE